MANVFALLTITIVFVSFLIIYIALTPAIAKFLYLLKTTFKNSVLTVAKGMGLDAQTQSYMNQTIDDGVSAVERAWNWAPYAVISGLVIGGFFIAFIRRRRVYYNPYY